MKNFRLVKSPHPLASRKLPAVSLAVLLAASTLASAGEIYGKIVANGATVGEGATVEMKCPKKSYPPVKTDKSGSYHVVVEENGKCSMTVAWKEKSASLDIASYDDAVQADLVLEVKDGKLTVRRK